MRVDLVSRAVVATLWGLCVGSSVSFAQEAGSGPKAPLGKDVLSVDGKQVAEVQTPKMVYGVFSFDDGLGIGVDDETNVSLDYKEGDNAFTGKINSVRINVK